MPCNRIALALACQTAVGSLAIEARAEQWHTYVNDRFGATADYPARFSVRDEPPANGDGQRFRTADGRAELAIFGFFDTERQAIRRVMEGRRKAHTRYTLADVRRDRFSLSGRTGDRINYQRCVRSPVVRDIFVCVELDYPSDELRAFEPIVGRSAASLRAGKPW